jgi:hypothetical protein
VVPGAGRCAVLRVAEQARVHAWVDVVDRAVGSDGFDHAAVGHTADAEGVPAGREGTEEQVMFREPPAQYMAGARLRKTLPAAIQSVSPLLGRRRDQDAALVPGHLLRVAPSCSPRRAGRAPPVVCQPARRLVGPAAGRFTDLGAAPRSRRRCR